MGSAKNWGVGIWGSNAAKLVPPWDVYDTFPKMSEQPTKRFNGDRIQLGGGCLGKGTTSEGE